MGDVVECKSLRDWARTLIRDQKAREKRCERAMRKTASRAVAYIKSTTVPKAFGELADSVHAEKLPGGGTIIVADAPHAAAVENGSRPHVVPLEALIKWVKLRGMQGLKSQKQIARLQGSSTRGHAKRVAAQIRDHQLAGAEATAVDAPEQIARAIQAAIAAHGTKPQHFMLKSEPRILELLNYYMDEAVLEKAGD